MARKSTVGIDDDLAAGEPAVAHGSAHHETAGWIDVVLVLSSTHFAGRTGFKISSMTASRRRLVMTSSECWVERTTASRRPAHRSRIAA